LIFTSSRDPRPLHSFPTRRSSDLARHGGARRYEVKILTKNGDERWLDISTAMIEFDGMLARMVSAFDLTERKHAEEKVQLLALRSEEHTSELQSRENLVCRLLLEK